MSVLTCPSTEEIFRLCSKECGVITSTEDQQYFALGCITCSDKFLYFDAFREHVKTMHLTYDDDGVDPLDRGDSVMRARSVNNDARNKFVENYSENDLSAIQLPPLMIKEENMDEVEEDNEDLIQNEPLASGKEDDYAEGYYGAKQEKMENGNGDSIGSYNETYATNDEELQQSNKGDDTNNDDSDEEFLSEDSVSSDVKRHIKDRKMIQFLIDECRRNTSLWDHRHPLFRNSIRRSQVIDHINSEFKKRFNITLSKDAAIRKWVNLRVGYKRECNRMALEKSNVSNLWYFKELDFLNMDNQQISDAAGNDTKYRRNYPALWNETSTNKMLQLLKGYPCFYDKFHIDYRSKEKRGEALKKMATELVGYIDVTTTQISKRISHLRFNYSKQKKERLMCEKSGREFAPSFSYYEDMFFMDMDIDPFKCEHCHMILNSPRELDTHLLTRHKIQTRPHITPAVCEKELMSDDGISNNSPLRSDDGRGFRCPYPNCGKQHTARSYMKKHIKSHYEEYKCDICGKMFRSSAYLRSHKQIHNPVKKHICKNCGAAFAQSSGLYVHKKRYKTTCSEIV